MKIHPVKTILMLTLLLILVQACGAPATETPTQPPADIPAPSAILHTVIPASLPAENSGVAADQDSSQISGEQTAGGRRLFSKERIRTSF